MQHSIDKVVSNGICVGCGACAVATQGRIQIRSNAFGIQQASIAATTDEDLKLASTVCPFAHEAVNEDILAEELFKATATNDKRTGFSTGIYASRVLIGEDIEASSSGGLTSWLTLKLLERGMIDGVIHVARGTSDALFEYVISTTADQLRGRRKSQYYSTSFANAIESIRNDGKRYALIGVPCFVKAARLLARQDHAFRSQLLYCIGLVCGHLKSSGFAELLAWQVGVTPDRLSKVDFRIKEAGKAAGDYSFAAWSKDSSQSAISPTRRLLGGNWGHAMFQLKACDYCDDIFAETADIAFGDAWLPQYSNEWKGTNVVVSRCTEIDRILAKGAERGEIMLEHISPDMAATSQSGNYRHRWDGMSIRLADDRAAGRWIPLKRIAPGSRVATSSRIRIVRLRRILAEISHSAFSEAKRLNSLEHFKKTVSPFVERMDLEYKMVDGNHISNALRRIKKSILAAAQKFRAT